MIRKDGLLAQIQQKNALTEGICETCVNLIQIGSTTRGCSAHDKLIMSEYPPHHGNDKCNDWRGKQ